MTAAAIAALRAAVRVGLARCAQLVARRPGLTAMAIVWLLCVSGLLIRGGPLL